jgi:hypothetical protein
MSSRRPGPCLWCESTDVHQIQWGLRAGDPTEGVAAAPYPPRGPRRRFVCGNCGRTWSHLPLKIRRGEVVDTERGPIKATAADVAWLRQIRAFLLEVFAQQRRLDAAELKEHVGFPHQLDEVGHLLELLTEDCARRGEPSLSVLVEGVPETPDERGGASTEIISQADINDLLDGVYGETEHPDRSDPAPEPA